MKVYYNESNKKKCAALNQLMKDGIIRRGDIDDRPIQEVQPEEVRDYERCHFFAGVGLWDIALDWAEWEEGRRVWTGSCPCQPFSVAGRQKGKADDRHLWPFWLRLIEQCQPPTVFGEQVKSAITHGWLDDVYQGLEKNHYAVGAVTMPASAVGAPHRRERLWFVGDSEYDGQFTNKESESKGSTVFNNTERSNSASQFAGTSQSSNVAYTNSKGLQRQRANGDKKRREGQDLRQIRLCGGAGTWINCPDGKQRLIEPTIPLLANGFPERDGVIHCAGDAIVPQLASEFISAFQILVKKVM